MRDDDWEMVAHNAQIQRRLAIVMNDCSPRVLSREALMEEKLTVMENRT